MENMGKYLIAVNSETLCVSGIILGAKKAKIEPVMALYLTHIVETGKESDMST